MLQYDGAQYLQPCPIQNTCHPCSDSHNKDERHCHASTPQNVPYCCSIAFISLKPGWIRSSQHDACQHMCPVLKSTASALPSGPAVHLDGSFANLPPSKGQLACNCLSCQESGNQIACRTLPPYGQGPALTGRLQQGKFAAASRHAVPFLFIATALRTPA